MSNKNFNYNDNESFVEGIYGCLERIEAGINELQKVQPNKGNSVANDEDRIAAALRQDANLVDQVADVIDGVVRCGIQFVDVERTSFVEGAARLAFVACFGAVRMLAVDRLCEDAGTGGFPHAARPAEEIGMRQLPALDGILER